MLSGSMQRVYKEVIELKSFYSLSMFIDKILFLVDERAVFVVYFLLLETGLHKLVQAGPELTL